MMCKERKKMTRSKKYVGIAIQVYAIAMFLLSLRNYAASSIRPTGMAEEIVLLSRPILYAIITVAALILIVIAWWKKENSTIIVLIWMGALLFRNYAMYHLGNISAPLLLQLITDRVSETFIYEHAMQQYAIVVAKLDAFGTAICMIVTTLYQKDHFRNIKVNLILFIAVILGVNFVDGYIDKPEFIILIVNVFNLLNLFLYTKELNKADSGKTFVELKSVKQIFENDE